MLYTDANVILLHGEDDFGITEFLKHLQISLGDSSTADMNISHVDGSGWTLENLRGQAYAAPFLAPFRLVILENGTSNLRTNEAKELFLKFLESLPPSTKLVIVEPKSLTLDDRGKPRNGQHWLVKWTTSRGEKALEQGFSVQAGGQMVNWVRTQAKKLGGEITPKAAMQISEMVVNNTRMADSEIRKLLAYVNYQRPINEADIEEAGAFIERQADFFGLTDAIGNRHGKKAQEILHILMKKQDEFMLFFGLAGHFRLLLQAREILENGGTESEVANRLSIHPFRAQKLYAQARNFSLGALEAIYKRFLDYDEEIKSGQNTVPVALDSLIVTLAS
ncbi:MAG: DNA polymerase III subunit delta [Anaerolineales bacterium]|nr:DNA polymerase III subunit delta [Anaerolineales bacterium]